MIAPPAEANKGRGRMRCASIWKPVGRAALAEALAGVPE
jgi:hypothetical protein